MPADRQPDRARPRGRLDLVATVVLLLALAVLAPLAQFYGAILTSPVNDCSAGQPRCGSGVDVGIGVGYRGPWVWWGLALLVSALRLTHRRTASWVPLVAAVLMVATVPVAAWISLSAIP